MKDFFVTHYFQIGTLALFGVGFMTLLLNNNLIRKIIGLNIMDTSIFLFFITIGYAQGREAPILNGVFKGVDAYVTPIPTGLMLTGIVVAVSVTAFALALTIQFFERFGTIDLSEVMDSGGD
jgi:multicomponent Na+:H+ antiporter subunit C